MATHSSILAWKIPWTVEPKGLQSRGVAKSQTRLSTHTHTHTHTHTVGSMKYRYLIVVLICIALMVNDIDYLFVCILAIYISSLEKYLEKAMAPHSSILAWKIPWMEEPGRLQSMGSLRVGHD